MLPCAGAWIASAGHLVAVETYLSLLETAWHRQEKPVRLIGLGVQLRDDENPDQADLFLATSPDDTSS